VAAQPPGARPLPQSAVVPTLPFMKITGREAGRALSALGVDRESARRALLAGVAGPGHRLGGLLLYESERVEKLISRASALSGLDSCALDPICQRGIFTARVGPRKEEASTDRAWKGADMTAPMSDQLDGVRMWWQMSSFTRVMLKLKVEQDGYFPFLATVAGFVVVGADIVGLERARPEGTAFCLREPSSWFDTLRHARLPVTRGGPWQLWSPEIAAARALPSAWLTTISVTANRVTTIVA
jgi:hypothetical protein